MANARLILKQEALFENPKSTFTTELCNRILVVHQAAKRKRGFHQQFDKDVLIE
jgi:hypothetical protein